MEKAANAEGWYEDPWHIHERRWFSDGSASHLVADGDQETMDDPPSGPWDGPLVPWRAPDRDSADDTRRADEAERNPSRRDYVDRAFDAFGQTVSRTPR